MGLREGSAVGSPPGVPGGAFLFVFCVPVVFPWSCSRGLSGRGASRAPPSPTNPAAPLFLGARSRTCSSKHSGRRTTRDMGRNQKPKRSKRHPALLSARESGRAGLNFPGERSCSCKEQPRIRHTIKNASVMSDKECWSLPSPLPPSPAPPRPPQPTPPPAGGQDGVGLRFILCHAPWLSLLEAVMPRVVFSPGFW